MKTAIFDLDGTIADTLLDLADAVNYGLIKLGYPVHPYESFNQFVGNGVQKLCRRALPEDKKDETDKLVEFFSGYYNEHFLDKTALYSGMSETVRRLEASGANLAVATNKPQEFAVKIVEALLPEAEFKAVLGGCDERPKKPDTAIINAILEKLPGRGGEVFMIGDSNVDIRTAKNAGIVSIGCVWGFRGREELEAEGADYIAEAPEDIARIILEGGKL